MTTSPELQKLAQETAWRVCNRMGLSYGQLQGPLPDQVQSDILTALQSAVASERERTLEACAALAENWPCNCHLHYPPPGKHQHHGHDCETEVGRDIAESMRALKSNKDLTNPTV